MASVAALSGKMQVLPGHVDAAKEREKDAETPPVNHCHTHTARRRAIPGGPQTVTKKWQKTSVRGWLRG